MQKIKIKKILKSNIQKLFYLLFLYRVCLDGVQLTLTIRIHLIRERPKPEMAPYLPAAEVVRQKDRKNPIQLKRNATVKAERKKMSDMSWHPKSKGVPDTCFCSHGSPRDKSPDTPTPLSIHFCRYPASSSPRRTRAPSLSMRCYTAAYLT